MRGVLVCTRAAKSINPTFPLSSNLAFRVCDGVPIPPPCWKWFKPITQSVAIRKPSRWGGILMLAQLKGHHVPREHVPIWGWSFIQRCFVASNFVIFRCSFNLSLFNSFYCTFIPHFSAQFCTQLDNTPCSAEGWWFYFYSVSWYAVCFRSHDRSFMRTAKQKHPLNELTSCVNCFAKVGYLIGFFSKLTFIKNVILIFISNTVRTFRAAFLLFVFWGRRL